MKKTTLLILIFLFILFDRRAVSENDEYLHFNVRVFKQLNIQTIRHALQLMQPSLYPVYAYENNLFERVVKKSSTDKTTEDFLTAQVSNHNSQFQNTSQNTTGVIIPPKQEVFSETQAEVKQEVSTEKSDVATSYSDEQTDALIKSQIDQALTSTEPAEATKADEKWNEIIQKISTVDETTESEPTQIDEQVVAQTKDPPKLSQLIEKDPPQKNEEPEISEVVTQANQENELDAQEEGENVINDIDVYLKAQLSTSSVMISDPVDVVSDVKEEDIFEELPKEDSQKTESTKEEIIIGKPVVITPEPVVEPEETEKELTLEEKQKMLPEGYTLEITDGVYQIDLKSKGFWTLEDAHMSDDFIVPKSIQEQMGIDPFVDSEFRQKDEFIGSQIQSEGTLGQNENAFEGSSTNRFIVKFKSDWPDSLDGCAQTIFHTGDQFRNYMMDGSSSIDELNRICRIKSVESVFIKRGSLNSIEAKRKQDQMFSTMREKYPERIERLGKSMEVPDLTNTYRFEVPEGADIEKICQLYENDPHVEYAHPDEMVKVDAFPMVPDDPSYSVLYGLNNTGQTGGTVDADIDAPEGWTETVWDFTGSFILSVGMNIGVGTVIAVVDTGVDWAHEDLASRIWQNPNETVNGLDDDGNGLIDDVRGWDFTECTSFTGPVCVGPKSPDNNPFDGDGHGTHVSGTAAAAGDNAIGIAGVAPSAEIMPLKALSDSGDGLFSWTAEAILYATDKGADVINNSYGCTPSATCASQPTMEAAVQTAYAMGVIVVFAAGNDNLDVADASPQNMRPETITVAATDDDDLRASFSNFGNLIDVSAPGVGIFSTLPLNQYGFSNGTSMAAPHVSGLAAAVIGTWGPFATSDIIRAMIRQSTDDLGVAGFDSLYGTGRVNLHRALDQTLVRPSIDPFPGQVKFNATIMTVDGTLLEFGISATDPNGDSLTFTIADPGLPLGATFVDNMDGTGTFSWMLSLGNALPISVAPIVFGVTDSELSSLPLIINIDVDPDTECGNGVIEFGENCDDGGTVNGDGCNSMCMLESCGDGVLDPAEFCDDGNLVNGDGCNDLCQLEACGNGIVDVGEECDDGNTTPGDGCNTVCVIEVCGNGVLDVGEECDDGNSIPGDGCGGTCRLEVCGNGTLDLGEECDDGNLTSGDGCSDMCLDEFCGDGIVNNGGIEQCDDGNFTDNDGCESCQLTPFCGDGTCNLKRDETCVTCQTDCGPCRGLRPRT